MLDVLRILENAVCFAYCAILPAAKGTIHPSLSFRCPKNRVLGQNLVAKGMRQINHAFR